VARLRLFGPARDLAGTGTLEIPATVVADVLAEATARFGPHFATILSSSRVWVNGVDAPPEQLLGDSDEVAVLPPVSGG